MKKLLFVLVVVVCFFIIGADRPLMLDRGITIKPPSTMGYSVKVMYNTRDIKPIEPKLIGWEVKYKHSVQVREKNNRHFVSSDTFYIYDGYESVTFTSKFVCFWKYKKDKDGKNIYTAPNLLRTMINIDIVERINYLYYPEIK